MPALDTPQFDWVRSRLPDRAQPVPPIFDPAVGARAIVAMAEHPRRELLVGAPTWLAVWGQKVAPGIMDRYLGRTGYRAQQTAEPRPARPDNLYAPLDATRDRGAVGRFAERSRHRSPLLEADLHRGRIGVGLAITAVGLVAAARLWPSIPRGGGA
jgi:hypothetical protein